MRQFFSPLWASLTAGLAGGFTWWYVSHVTHRREAWDASLYFTLAIPLIAAVACVLAFFQPIRTWRWAMIPFGAQALVAFAMNPTANLLPLGLIMFGIFGGLCTIPASMAAWLRRKVLPA